MKSEIQVASISDIHWGHRNTPTRHILGNLERAFPDTDETGRLDLIIFGGDQFDRLLPADDPDLEYIKAWWNGFLRMCYRRGIVVRVLRGTPSHDWRQNWMLAVEADHAHIPVDVAFVDVLAIEYIAPLGIHVLYVPDEWRPETDDVWAEVCQLMRDRNLEKVDFSVVHGCFVQQLPEHVKVPRHVPERYMGITNGYVLGAHIHKPSVYGENFLCNGSFDRISHGEEENKGHWRIRYTPGGERSAKFIVNEGARTYVTVDCTGMPLEDALSVIRQRAKDLPVDSNIRIQANKDDPISVSLEQMRRDYPTYQWTSKINKEISTQPQMLVDLRTTFTQVSITPDNIHQLMAERLSKRGIEPDRIQTLLGRLSEFV